ncbi:MAG: hypothetical protein NZM29_06430 [Nitrospira sp.]|nr:hypothetical protein [Nitrospira sp.]
MIERVAGAGVATFTGIGDWRDGHSHTGGVMPQRITTGALLPIRSTIWYGS